MTGQLKSIRQKFQLAGVVLVVLNPHVFNLTGQLESKPPEFPTLAATDLPVIIRENCSHLTADEREKLLSVLLRFESLFDGTLADWNLLPVSFEPKEGMKPYHCRPYPIPHKHKAVLMKEIKWLCNIGVLE